MIGMKDPESSAMFAKAYGLLTNSKTLAEYLQHKCDGKHEHILTLGRFQNGQLKRAYTETYPPELLASMMEGALVEWHAQKTAETLEKYHTVLPAGSDPEPEAIRGLEVALRRLHNNLGHAHVDTLLRMLRNGGQARQRSRWLETSCAMCV